MSEAPFKYRGRVFDERMIELLKEIIATHPLAHRRALSKIVCEILDWRQQNGHLRDMVCRGAMLALHRMGRITLPPARRVSPNNAINHRQVRKLQVDQSPICSTLLELGKLEFRQVRRTKDEPLFSSLLAEHHYLGYCRPVGEHLKYLVFSDGRPIACVAWSSPPRHLEPRDRFIGWSMAARLKNLQLLAYNTRFLILPWIKVPHLASHILGAMSRRIAKDWQVMYGHPVVYLETFVDLSRFAGTCYRAANWTCLGQTSGRGHNARTKACDKPKKEVLGHPLDKRFREILNCV